MDHFRPFDAHRDRDAVRRIWREVGWARSDGEAHVDRCLAGWRNWIAEVDGAAECHVGTALGHMRYQHDDLRLSCIAAVTTGRVARRQGLAGRLTARALAADVAQGAVVAVLGMFEQGYYDRLGFGTGAYEKMVTLDPARLRLDGVPAPRVPRRLTPDDWQAVHASRLGRFRGHGARNFDDPRFTRAEMREDRNGFGLGYLGPGGEVAHHVWCIVPDDERRGPYHVTWTAWRTREEFLELMGLLRNLGDQVHALRICEPAGIQLQDLLHKPFQRDAVSERSALETRSQAIAFWQARICDLPACLEPARFPGGELRFNLAMADPIETCLDPEAPWRGAGGDWIVTLGASSGAERGSDPALPTLTATVNAFTRLWLGVRPATGLAVTDRLAGPRDLFERLDDLVRLPEPHPDWDF